MVFILLVSALFLLAFAFLDMSHEVLKKRIRRISAKKTDDTCPRELDYLFFRLDGSGSARPPWQRYGRRERQIADRDDFIREYAPWPRIIKLTDFIPPIPISSNSMISVLQPRFSA